MGSASAEGVKTAESMWAYYVESGWWNGLGVVGPGQIEGEATAAVWAWIEERKQHRAPTATCLSCIEYTQMYGPKPPDGFLALCKRIRRNGALKHMLEKSKRVRRLRNEIKGAIWWEILERDDFRCQHCGVRRFLTVDHIIALDNGGTNERVNLQTLCRGCNSSKGNR